MCSTIVRENFWFAEVKLNNNLLKSALLPSNLLQSDLLSLGKTKATIYTTDVVMITKIVSQKY